MANEKHWVVECRLGGALLPELREAAWKMMMGESGGEGAGDQMMRYREGACLFEALKWSGPGEKQEMEGRA